MSAENPKAISDDLLRGAGEIAGFLFSDAAQRRRIYHLAATSRLPVFKLGAMICARRSTLLAWIERQEQAPGGRKGL